MLIDILLALALPASANLLEAARLSVVPAVGPAIPVRVLALDKPMDFTSVELKGRLLLRGRREVVLADSRGGSFALTEGPVTLRYGKPTVTSFLTRERSVSLSGERGTAVFPARSSDFDGFGSFATVATDEQPVVLQGLRKRAVLRESTREAYHSCTYAGYCLRTAIGTDGQLSTGYGFSSTCSGTRKVLELVRYVRTDVSVELRLRGTAEAGAVVVGEPSFKEETSVAKDLSSCG